MTESRLQQLISYFKASKSVLQASIEKFPDKINMESSKVALVLMTDTVSILEYLEKNINILNDIEQEKTDLEELIRLVSQKNKF